MNRRLAGLQLGLFGLFLVLPVGVLIALGPPAPYVYGRAQTEWPPISHLLAFEPEARQAFATALLDRLAVRRETIRLRNTLTWSATGSIDREKVVSGAPGWLFYKPAFAAWDCERHGRLDRGLHRLALLTELAAANDLPLVIANAPNKAAIARDQSGGRADLYSACFYAYEARARRRFADLDSAHFIDHAPGLLEREGEEDTYLPTDTHWTRRAAYAAFEDLLRETALDREAPPKPKPDTTEKISDLGNQILLVGAPLEDPSYAATSIEARAVGEGVVVIHDSFYQEAPDLLDAMLPGVRRVNVNFPEFSSIDLREAEHVVLESAERAILSRVLDHGFFGWHSRVGRWLLDGMDRAAASCRWTESRDLTAGAERSSLSLEADGSMQADGPAPKLFVSLPEISGDATCLRLTLSSQAPVHPRQVARLYLDAKQVRIAPEDRVFEFVHGRTVELRYGRRRDGTAADRLAFVLPASAAGRRIRIDFQELPADARLGAIEVAPRFGAAPARSANP
ncbi:MAG: hypothetical protein CL931_04165 [Deltaproteobacteria bacterium]|nr:hypothetical protein [Deltaproteobacteria bacterium]